MDLMRLRKRTLAIGCTLTLGLVLGGCSGTTTGSGEDVGGAQEEPTANQDATSDPGAESQQNDESHLPSDSGIDSGTGVDENATGVDHGGDDSGASNDHGSLNCAPLDLSGNIGNPPMPSCQECTGSPSCPAEQCDCSSLGFIPLMDLGKDFYRGVQGGLYCDGSNSRPAGHESAGMTIAQAIQPLNSAGNPDPNGQYALISIGMSNTTQSFSKFIPLANADPGKDPHLIIVDGAQYSQTAEIWADPNAAAWGELDSRLQRAGVSKAQVAIAWVKVCHPYPQKKFPEDALILSNDMMAIAKNLKARFPNIAIAYYSSRIYAGYCDPTRPLSPEPSAYQGGFAVKRTILEQITGNAELNYDPAHGTVKAPWLAWGPYLWADGITPRSDSLVWNCTDLTKDGVHPSDSGRDKVANMLLQFAKSDSTARQWFLKNP